MLALPVFGAELAVLPLYGVTRKAGFALPTLIENGAACFPTEIRARHPKRFPIWNKPPDVSPSSFSRQQVFIWIVQTKPFCVDIGMQ
jgi:hypothetical protein